MAGNANSGRRQEKPFADALRIEIAARASDDQRGLRAIARKLLDAAELGELAAIKEVGDRLDGKPAQAIQHSGEVTTRPATSMSDDELAAIASGSSATADPASLDPSKLN